MRIEPRPAVKPRLLTCLTRFALLSCSRGLFLEFFRTFPESFCKVHKL
jgi:hypothetical protein